MVLADSSWKFPLAGLFLTMLFLFLWIIWLFLFIRIVMDIFRSRDMSGVHKAIWLLLLLVLPYLGALIYLIVRGTRMADREIASAQEADAQLRSYIQTVAGPSRSVADELQQLAVLRDQGVVSAAEFDSQKSKLLG